KHRRMSAATYVSSTAPTSRATITALNCRQALEVVIASARRFPDLHRVTEGRGKALHSIQRRQLRPGRSGPNGKPMAVDSPSGCVTPVADRGSQNGLGGPFWPLRVG